MEDLRIGSEIVLKGLKARQKNVMVASLTR